MLTYYPLILIYLCNFVRIRSGKNDDHNNFVSNTSYGNKNNTPLELASARSGKRKLIGDVELDLASASKAFTDHLYHKIESTVTIEEYMSILSKTAKCQNKPIYMTMAKVSSTLYWQLIENFFYTMYVFGHLDCAVMVCISDPVCISKCKSQRFPCYNYQHPNPSVSTFEQVAKVKIYHVAKALRLGVNVLLLDLDVGFLRDPLLLYEGFLENPYEHLRSQMDVGFGNEKKSNTMTTFPRPNFGIFLIKSNEHSIKLFDRAWRLYEKIPAGERDRVATDQNVVVGAVKWARWRFDYNFSYFFLGYYLDTYPRPILLDKKALLLDKMQEVSDKGVYFELGGKPARDELSDAIVVHATCYEKSTKLMGLKAANAFWNIEYYDPNRRTLTKPVMFRTTTKEFRKEVLSLAHLALLSNRTLILPNVLVGTGYNVLNSYRSPSSTSDGRSSRRRRFQSPSEQDADMSHAPHHRGEYYWPAFRTVQNTFPDLEVVEPAYYYRIESDFRRSVPPPEVLTFQITRASQRPSGSGRSSYRTDFSALLEVLQSRSHPRVVLDLQDAKTGDWGPPSLRDWAADSFGDWGGPATGIDKSKYVRTPYPKEQLIDQNIIDKFRMCKTFLWKDKGNRTCFEKCM